MFTLQCVSTNFCVHEKYVYLNGMETLQKFTVKITVLLKGKHHGQ